MNERTDHYNVPRITNINKVTIFVLYGPTKYLQIYIFIFFTSENEKNVNCRILGVFKQLEYRRILDAQSFCRILYKGGHPLIRILTK